MASEKCKVRGRLVSYVDMLLIAGGCIHLFDEVVRRHNKLSSIKINGALLHAHHSEYLCKYGVHSNQKKHYSGVESRLYKYIYAVSQGLIQYHLVGGTNYICVCK
jgi:hypothetical protein